MQTNKTRRKAGCDVMFREVERGTSRTGASAARGPSIRWRIPLTPLFFVASSGTIRASFASLVQW